MIEGDAGFRKSGGDFPRFRVLLEIFDWRFARLPLLTLLRPAGLKPERLKSETFPLRKSK